MQESEGFDAYDEDQDLISCVCVCAIVLAIIAVFCRPWPNACACSDRSLRMMVIPSLLLFDNEIHATAEGHGEYGGIHEGDEDDVIQALLALSES